MSAIGPVVTVDGLIDLLVELRTANPDAGPLPIALMRHDDGDEWPAVPVVGVMIKVSNEHVTIRPWDVGDPQP